MAYDFLGLVNDVNRRLNEVELNATNFAGAIGFYGAAKEAVNAAIRQINYQQYEWPFNHATAEETLDAGTTRYAFPPSAKTVDMDTFRIKKSEEFNTPTSRLSIISYEDYLDRYVDQEYNFEANSGLPRYVFRTPDNSYGLVPVPDNDYEIVYEYFQQPTDLVSATDVPTIPEQFRNIIIDGAMYHAYLFRGNSQDATLMQDKFINGIKQMRSLYINRTDYVRTGMIERTPYYNKSVRL